MAWRWRQDRHWGSRRDRIAKPGRCTSQWMDPCSWRVTSSKREGYTGLYPRDRSLVSGASAAELPPRVLHHNTPCEDEHPPPRPIGTNDTRDKGQKRAWVTIDLPFSSLNFVPSISVPPHCLAFGGD